MKHCDYFKLQAKNLLRDYKTQFWNKKEGVFEYEPRFFDDIDEIVMNFNLDEKKPFGLMNSQHLIAKLAGFEKWGELIAASESSQEIGKLLLDNRQNNDGFMTNLVPSIIVEDWKAYLCEFLKQNNLKSIDDKVKLAIFKQDFLGEGEIEEEVKKPHEELMEIWLEWFDNKHRKAVWKYAKDINEKKPIPYIYKTKVPAQYASIPLQVFNIWNMFGSFTQDEQDGFDKLVNELLKDCTHKPIRGPRTKLTEEYYNENNPFENSFWDKEVECIHCGKKFLFNDAEIEDDLIVCPTDGCDGSLIDFMPINN